MRHVILLAPHFPANQRRFVQGLKAVGALVTGIVDTPWEHVDHEVRGLLDAYEVVTNVCDPVQVEAAVRRIQARGPWVHRLEATVEAHMNCAARVRDACGIPGLSVDVVERCRDKITMKRHLRDQGFAVAQDRPVTDAASALQAAQELGFPVILKPRDGAGASKTYRIGDRAQLAQAVAETGLAQGGGFYTMEQFMEGHEAFYDTLSVDGVPVYEFVSHYFPGVLHAMRDRSVNPMILTTNRVELDSYAELRDFGRRVIAAMGIGTAPTHMEWFYGPRGLVFSEIGARPPGVNVWDLYAAANDLDLYTEWARALCFGDVWATPSRRLAGGLLNIRPTADGVVRGHVGVDQVQARFGEHILSMHLPPVGSRTQPIDAGYRANGWVYALHPDYDVLREMLTEIGRTLKIVAG